jgi:hypothetical protein
MLLLRQPCRKIKNIGVRWIKTLGRELSNEIKEFIAEHVHSVLQLEVLLLVNQNKDKVWTPAAVGRELQLSAESAKVQLDGLSRRLLTTLDGPGKDLYRYNYSSDELNQTVSQLATAYATQRVAVLTLIFAKRIDKVGLFKETFRMIKGEE